MPRWKTLILTGVVTGTVLIGAAGSALSEDKIYTGGKSGSYYTAIGPLLKDALSKYFFKYEVVASAGSQENIRQVAASPSAIGLVQSDSLSVEMSRNADLAKRITIIRNDVADECAFAVTSAANAERLDTWGDVESYGRRLALITGPAESGSATTLAYIKSLSDSLKDVSVTNAESVDAAIDAVIGGKADVAFFVQFADVSNARFKKINGANLAFIPVINRAILRQNVGGHPLFVPTEVKVTGMQLLKLRKSEKLTTACTPIAYITGNPDLLAPGNAQEDQKDMIAKLRAVSVEALRPKDAWFKQMLQNTARATGAGLESVLQAVDKAAAAVRR